MKDPKEMTEEEKVLWKVKVFRECEATEDIIKGAINMIHEQRDELKSTIQCTNDIQKEYQEAVERIGKRAQELMLPEIKKQEEIKKKLAGGPRLNT